MTVPLSILVCARAETASVVCCVYWRVSMCHRRRAARTTESPGRPLSVTESADSVSVARLWVMAGDVKISHRAAPSTAAQVAVKGDPLPPPLPPTAKFAVQ